MSAVLTECETISFQGSVVCLLKNVKHHCDYAVHFISRAKGRGRKILRGRP